MIVCVNVFFLLVAIPKVLKADPDLSAVYYMLLAKINDANHELRILQEQLAETKAKLESVKEECKATDTTNETIMSVVRAIQFNLSYTTEHLRGLVTEAVSNVKEENKGLRKDVENLIETKIRNLQNEASNNTENLLTMEKNLIRLADNQQVLSNNQDTLNKKLNKHILSFKEDVKNAMDHAESCQTGYFGKSKYLEKPTDPPNFPYTTTVSFDKPFSHKPVVTVGISRLDFWHQRNLRVDFAIAQVTGTQFKVIMKSWSDSVAYGIGFYWMACPT